MRKSKRVLNGQTLVNLKWLTSQECSFVTGRLFKAWLVLIAWVNFHPLSYSFCIKSTAVYFDRTLDKKAIIDPEKVSKAKLGKKLL